MAYLSINRIFCHNIIHIAKKSIKNKKEAYQTPLYLFYLNGFFNGLERGVFAIIENC